MPYDSNSEFFTASISDAEVAMRIANGWGADPKWTITEFDRGLVTHYCLTRADGSTDQRATRTDIYGAIVKYCPR